MGERQLEVLRALARSQGKCCRIRGRREAEVLKAIDEGPVRRGTLPEKESDCRVFSRRVLGLDLEKGCFACWVDSRLQGTGREAGLKVMLCQNRAAAVESVRSGWFG